MPYTKAQLFFQKSFSDLGSNALGCTRKFMKLAWGGFQTSWAHGAKHRDSSIHFAPYTYAKLLRSFLTA